MTPTTPPSGPEPANPEQAPAPLLGAALAEALGPRWSWAPDPDNPEHGGFLVERHGMRLAVAVGASPARTKAERDGIRVMLDAAELRAHLPNVRYPVIRVPGDRAAKSVAESIRKRLLPQAQTVLAAARQAAEAAVLGTRHQTRMLAALAALSGGEVLPGSPPAVRVGDVADPVHAHVGIDTPQDVAQFAIEVPMSLAPLVAELIGRLRAASPAEDPAPGT